MEERDDGLSRIEDKKKRTEGRKTVTRWMEE